MSYKFVPSVFTAGNLIAGMLAIVAALHGEFDKGVYLVLLATILDGLDGRLARRFNSASDFGKELDSLADLVSFGVAPALLAYAKVLQDMELAGLLLTIVFALCGALRLARFNVLNISDFFMGMPITIAGALLAVIVLFTGALPDFILPLSMPVLSWLMISKIKIPKC